MLLVVTTTLVVRAGHTRVAPQVERYNGVDDDCNGSTDDHACAGQAAAFYRCVEKTTLVGACVTGADPQLSNTNSACLTALSSVERCSRC